MTPDRRLNQETVTDPLRQYLNEIGQYELLDPEQERSLGKMVQAGQAAQERIEEDERRCRSGDGEPFTDEYRALLDEVCTEAAKAKQQMINSNLRLVVSIAKKYHGNSMDMLDIIQEGNAGMVHAVDLFDPTKGYKFSTYATWWIKQAISRGVSNQSRTIRIPSHIHEDLRKLENTEKTLAMQHGVEPSPAMLAKACGLRVGKVLQLKDIHYRLNTTSSLNKPIGEDSDAELQDVLPDTVSTPPEGEALQSAMRQEVRQALGALDEKEQFVIYGRFGLHDGEAKTLDAIGDKLGLTRERIRQIQNRALTKLRHNPEVMALLKEARYSQ